MTDDRPNVPVPDELATVRAELKRLETREAELRELILANPDIRTGANWVAEVKTVTAQRCDIKELRANHPDIAEQFTFPVDTVRVVLSGIDQDTGEIITARRMRQATESSPA